MRCVGIDGVCGLRMTIDPTTNRYDGRCVRCFCAAFPDDARAIQARRGIHVKEQTVRTYLQSRFSQLQWVMDRSVDGTRRRPDHRPLIHLIGVTTHDLIIETDEHSHWFYICNDEREKEDQVHYWLSERKKPLVWIRFNPDAYEDAVTGVTVSSCFSYSKTKSSVYVPLAQQQNWDNRLSKLAQIIDEYLVDRCDLPMFTPIELFYNNVIMRKL